MFALSESELGETDLVQHRIEMKESVPFQAPPYRLPYALCSELEAELKQEDALRHVQAHTHQGWYSSGKKMEACEYE